MAHEEFEFARKLNGRIENGKVRRSGQYENEKYLSVLYYADEKANWTDKAVWKAVNPPLDNDLHSSVLEGDDLPRLRISAIHAGDDIEQLST